MDKESIKLYFYGISVMVSGPAELVSTIGREFLYFNPALYPCDEGKVTGTVSVEIYQETPPFEKIPPVRASMYQPDSIAYDDGSLRYIDYGGQALAIFDYCGESAKIFSEDQSLLHELAYLLINSRVGEQLDRQGMHRIHAFGVSAGGKGIVCLLPQNGGKTTLYLGLLNDESVKVFSDDTPLTLRNGTLLPFPLRIGVREGYPLDIPGRYLSTMQRRKYGVKTLIDAGYFAHRVSAACGCRVLLIGEREHSSNAVIKRVGRLRAVFPLIKNVVIGLGLPQVVEFFLRSQWKDLLAKTGIVLSRLFACCSLLLKSETFVFVIGTDNRKNTEVLKEFMAKMH